jgi:DNA-binding NtrC family response regulator
MGLSTVYGIVKDLKGDISVYSAPGTGTTFQVLIPEKRPDADQETFLARAALITGNGSILVVDDEPSIVAWTSKVLAKLGYGVTGVSGGQKALDMLANDPDRFDLVLTDLAMPKMDGLALSQQINRICPDIPIILCTGFSDGLKPDLIENCHIFAMIMKPMIASELSAIVNKALEKSRQKEQTQ